MFHFILEQFYVKNLSHFMRMDSLSDMAVILADCSSSPQQERQYI